MSELSEEIMSYFDSSKMSDDEFIEHYGMPRRSGRYPWGSGKEPYQSGRDFLGRVEQMRKSDFTYVDEDGKTWTGDNAIAKSLGYSSSDFRTVYAIAKDQRRSDDVATAKRLRDKEGMNISEIGRKMGINESSVRSLLNENSESKMKEARDTAEFLKKRLNEQEYGMLDVGIGVNKELNISKEKLDQALFMLQAEEGYNVYSGGVPQATNKGKQTTQKVLTKPEVEYKDIYDYDKVGTVGEYVSHDDGHNFDKKFSYPVSLDSKRLKIVYDEDGGTLKDGVMEIRPGVKDLSLGNDRYAQCRIMVDGTHYLKGMAVYGDPKKFPDGVDIIFNTNKAKGTPTEKVLKAIKEDPDNPFGALIKEGGQNWYTDENGNRKLGLVNKTRSEGEWNKWKDTLPSQFLAKQSKELAKRQLDIAVADKKAELDEIMALTNPTVKKHYLDKYAEARDTDAYELKGAALPGQRYHVILPVNSLKDNEVYAPGYENGSKLALVRFPHGNISEIPILTVNNKNKDGEQMIGKSSIDAIGINHKNADRMSGADYDGDFVLTIPTHGKNGKVKIQNAEPLKELENFDTKHAYGGATSKKDAEGNEHWYRNGKEFTHMKKTDLEMGRISNLLTDMTMIGAEPSEIARALKHSMVVIDAEKHHLDYKQSERDNNIAGLRRKYQKHVDENGNVRYGGASTLLSKAGAEVDVPRRQGTPKVNLKGKDYYDPNRPEGALIYTTAKDNHYSYIDKNGVLKEGDRTQKAHRMSLTDDAMTLVSPYRHPMEVIYANYANEMKGLANKARVLSAQAGKIAYSRDAKNKYQNEVRSLTEKLRVAEMNAPRERAANRQANASVQTKIADAKAAGKELKKKDIRKMNQQALTKARNDLGSSSRRERNITVTDKEWEAIQKGAVSETTLRRILNNCDPDSLRSKAMPKQKKEISNAVVSRMKAMSGSYTLQQIADKFGLSPATVSKYLKGEL